ncbi:hypothetical protein ACRB68_53320 [Actinomadura sp. RB68]|uniref:Uncharacterized protein n=1 Tax=Actinomadura macrotermitis TaxID=2585200 RepID=A0A7K0C284_9ACTN|nr:hypothetical protein [Actinomadura macrotermitis]
MENFKKWKRVWWLVVPALLTSITALAQLTQVLIESYRR